MKTITVFKTSTGEITSNVTCQIVTLPGYIREGCEYIEGCFPYADYFIDTLTKTPVAKGIAPNQWHVFDYTEKRWLPDSLLAWKEIRALRDTLLKGTDWLVTKSQETNVPVAPLWLAYRQSLRDVTLQGDPWAITWPVVP